MTTQIIYDWIVNGADPKNEPDIKYGRFVTRGTLYRTGKLTSLIKAGLAGAGAYVTSLFAEIEYGEYYNRGDFHKFIENFVPFLRSQAGYTFDIDIKSTGTYIAGQIGFDNPKAKAVAGADGSISWDDIWNANSDNQKANVIYEYLLYSAIQSAPGTTTTLNTTSRAAYNSFFDPSFNYNSNTKHDIPWIIEREYTGFNETYYYTQDGDHYEVGTSFAQKINNAFFSPSDFTFVKVNEEPEIQKQITEEQSEVPSIKTNQDAERKLAADNLRQKGLLADLNKKAEDEDASEKAKREAFFKEAEQCILLSRVHDLAVHRKGIRKNTIDTFNTIPSSPLPYGGRIIPVNFKDGYFLNSANNAETLYDYTSKLITEMIEDFTYQFMISKVNTVKDNGKDIEVEMPLLFGEQENIISNGETGRLARVNVQTGGDGIDQLNEDLRVEGNNNKVLEQILRVNPNILRSSIKYTDLKITFNGENQATAKTNVDVSLTIEMPSLDALHAEFTSTTTYLNEQGSPVEYNYDYSILDLITYLHRSDLSGYWEKLNKDFAYLYNTKFLNVDNRLVMRIKPNFKQGYTGDAYNIIKQHLNDEAFILDLALVDHTIENNPGTEEPVPKITIEYKGYIRNRMQYAAYDIIRNYNQIEQELKDEENLLDKLNDPKETPDKAIAIDTIDQYNLDVLTKSKQASDNPWIIDSLIANNKMFKCEVETRKYKGNLTKNYEFLDPITVHDSFVLTTSGKVDVQASSQSGLGTDEITQAVVASGKVVELNFFYLGDIIDSALDNVYENNRSKPAEELRDYFKNLPLKVIIPSFKPLKPIEDAQGNVSWTDDKSDIVSLADFPISLSWFGQWYTKEIIDSEVKFYTIGTFVTKLVTTVLNSFMIDQCYLNGSHKKVQYAVKSEFGLWSKQKDDAFINQRYANNNISYMHRTMVDPLKFSSIDSASWLEGNYSNTSFAELKKGYAPFLGKSLDIPRVNHCNFLVIYPQVSVFSNYETSDGKGLVANDINKREKNIPEYFPRTNAKNEIKLRQFTKSLSFSKSTANYQREARYEAENLYTLAQIASVYNVSAVSEPILSLFPGMLIFVNPGLYVGPAIGKTIANILGLGGFYITEKVEHSGKIEGQKITDFKTTASGIWISSGERLLQNNRVPPSNQKVGRDNRNTEVIEIKYKRPEEETEE